MARGITAGFAMFGVMANQVQMFVAVSTIAKQQIAAGTVRGLAVTTAQRSTLLPQLPTLAESGAPGYDLEQWWGIVVPAGTPRQVVDALNAELTRIMATPEVRQFMAREGAKATPSTPERFGAHLSAELQRWNDLAARAGVKVPD